MALLNADDSDLNADWIKTLGWDLPSDPEALRLMFGPDWYATLSRLPSWKAAPAEVRNAAVAKHYSGSHDQRSHAGKSGAELAQEAQSRDVDYLMRRGAWLDEQLARDGMALPPPRTVLDLLGETADKVRRWVDEKQNPPLTALRESEIERIVIANRSRVDAARSKRGLPPKDWPTWQSPEVRKADAAVIGTLRTFFAGLVDDRVFQLMERDKRPLAEMDGPFADLMDVMLDAVSRAVGDVAPTTVIKFAPGLVPVLKHGSPGQKGYAAMHPNGRAGRGEKPEGAADEMTGYAGLNVTTAQAVTKEADDLGVPVRAVEAEFERRLELAKTMPDPYQPGHTAESGGMVWYSESRLIADRVGDGDTAKGAGMLAALSAQNPWPSNITAAELVSEMSRDREKLGLTDDPATAWAHYQSVQKEYGVNAKKETGRAGGTGPVDERAFTLAWRIANGESPASVLTGRKRRNFYNNILGDPESVTVDVHMMKALSTTPGSRIVGKKQAAAFWQQAWDNSKSAEKKGEEPRLVDGVGYSIAAQAVINVARRRGLEPRQVQAIIWNTCVTEKWVTPPGAEDSNE